MEVEQTIQIVAAMADNGVIGLENRLPWHLPADLKHFKSLTKGRPMIMGRKTWESLPGLLPGRPHIVVSRDPDYRADKVRVAGSLEAALELAGPGLVSIIGGAQIYALAMPLAHRLQITRVHAEPEGDAWFPRFDAEVWQLHDAQYRAADERNALELTFETYQRD